MTLPQGPPVQVGPTIVHTLPTASEPAAAAPATTEVPAPAPAPASAPADPSTIETAPGWTAADDEKLLHLKAGGKTWKDIHAEMGGKRAIKDIKRRCNDLNKVKATSEGTEAGKEAEAKAAETKEDTGKQQTKEDSTESGQRPIIYLDEGDELDVHEVRKKRLDQVTASLTINIYGLRSCTSIVSRSISTTRNGLT